MRYRDNTVKGTRRGSKWPEAVKTACMCDLLTDNNLSVVARRHGVPESTLRTWERQARELTLGELDGLIKYTDQTMLAGRTTAEALVAERQREAHLSLYGHPLLRFTMNEVRSAGMLAKKLQTAGIRQTALPTWLNEVDL